MMNAYEKTIAREVAGEAVKAGFRAFLAESGTYGFFTDGDRVVCFQVDLGVPTFSGNYVSKHCGSGWRMNDGMSMKRMIASNPPHWATKGEQVKMETLEGQLKKYQRSSKYREVTSEFPRANPNA